MLSENLAKLTFDKNRYSGGSDIAFKVKYNTMFEEPLYYSIVIKDECSLQTLTANSGLYSFSAVRTKQNILKSSTKPVDDFSNSLPNCPITWSVVKEDKGALDNGLENILDINDGYLQLNEAHYQGGSITAFVKATTRQ